jgi:hypothetical protein
MEERIKKKWSTPTVLPSVFYILNSSVSSETGVIPFHAHFGTKASTYHKMPEGLDPVATTHEYVRLLDVNLQLLTEISKRYQDELVVDRTSKSDPVLQNQYQAGDFVLFQLNPDNPLPNKLHPKYLGPFEVISQFKNDVECRNLIYGTVSKYHVERLKLFYGTKEEAFKMAQIDNDQYVITRFIAYRGDPDTRTTMEFEVEFRDGSHPWLPWSNDLFDTVQYEEFCEANSALYLLKFRLERSRQVAAEINRTPITAVDVGTKVYVDLRSYGSVWYETLPLDDKDHLTYVLVYEYAEWVGTMNRKIWVRCELLDEYFDVPHLWVRRYGSNKTFDVENMILVDENFILAHPELVSERNREIVLQRCRELVN